MYQKEYNISRLSIFKSIKPVMIYIVGINRMTETTIECEEYDANGVYIQQTIVDRPQTNIVC